MSRQRYGQVGGGGGVGKGVKIILPNITICKVIVTRGVEFVFSKLEFVFSKLEFVFSKLEFVFSENEFDIPSIIYLKDSHILNRHQRHTC